MAKTPATYYVRLDTFWQHSPDRFAGPFGSREAAEAAIDAATTNPAADVVRLDRRPRDIKYAIRVYGVLPASQALRLGMCTPEMTDYSRTNVISRIPLDTDDLFELEQIP